jgi:hypothetical protein
VEAERLKERGDRALTFAERHNQEAEAARRDVE